MARWPWGRGARAAAAWVPWWWLGVLLASIPSAEGGANLARGRKVTFAPAPNYRLTIRGDTDAVDLTDGQLSSRKDHHLWFDARAVGFSYSGLAQLAVDLGSEADVGEVAVRFQGGAPQAGVCFPGWVDLLASADGERYHCIASYSKWKAGDKQRYGVPRNEGKGWVHKLRFREVKVRARYIGLSFYTTGLCVADELWVLAGPEGAEYRPPSEGALTDFTVAGPRMYFHKPVVFVPTNLNAPTPVGLITPPGLRKQRVTAILDLPRGVSLVGGSLGGVSVADAKRESTEGGRFARHVLAFDAGGSNKAWGRIYLRSTWPTDRAGVLRHQLRWEGGASPLVEQPIRAIRVEPAPRPKRLRTGLGWWSLHDTMAWPDALEAFQALGFNTVPMFARWTKLDDPAVATALARFRAAGFKVQNIDSIFHHMIASAGDRKGELFCQLADGAQGSRFCPSYRGPLYGAEIDRVASDCVRAKVDYVDFDIELWNWRGPIDAPKCSCCQADFKKSGARDWQTWQLDKGLEIWRDVAARIHAARTKAGLPDPELGVYDWRAGHDYQFSWPFDRLYPQLLGSSQVSTYTPYEPYHLELIGDEARADRKRLPKSDVIPWLTPGDSGTFPGEMFTWALLECFANGSRGVNFWSGRVWDAETLAAYARAIRMVAPVEDIIVDGQLVAGVRCEPAMRVSGMRRGDDLFLLIADYHSREPKAVTVELPTAKAATVVDLATGKALARLGAGERRFTLSLGGELAKALSVVAH